jgi:hypothetical protein
VSLVVETDHLQVTISGPGAELLADVVLPDRTLEVALEPGHQSPHPLQPPVDRPVGVLLGQTLGSCRPALRLWHGHPHPVLLAHPVGHQRRGRPIPFLQVRAVGALEELDGLLRMGRPVGRLGQQIQPLAAQGPLPVGLGQSSVREVPVVPSQRVARNLQRVLSCRAHGRNVRRRRRYHGGKRR